jgi:hypothetical protein
VNVHLHIERVVVDGPLAVAGARLEAALAAALRDRLAQEPRPPDAVHEARRGAPDVVLATGRAEDAIARAVAGALLPGDPGGER